MDEIVLTGTEDEAYFTGYYYLKYDGNDDITKIVKHKHDFYEIIFYVDGNIEYEVEDFTYTLQYGDIMVIPPNALHNANIQTQKGSYRRYILWIAQDFINRLFEFDDCMSYMFQYIKMKETYRLRMSLKDMNQLIYILGEIMEKQHTMEFGYQTKCKAMLYDLLYRLNSILYQDAHYDFELQRKEIYLEIADYIKENLKEDLSLDTLANQFYMSKYHMSHVFKQKMSISIHKYIVIRRLEFGKALILSGQAISKVHEHCGFKDYVTFYRAFKKRHGMSPTDYYQNYTNLSID